MTSGMMAKSGLTASARAAPAAEIKADDDLHLAHQRQNLALAAIDRQPRVHPALRAAFDQHAAVNPGPFELFNRLAGASAGLAEHIDRNSLRAALSLKGGRVEVVERDQLRARHMRGGELARRADIEQLGGAALRQQAVKFERFN